MSSLQTVCKIGEKGNLLYLIITGSCFVLIPGSGTVIERFGGNPSCDFFFRIETVLNQYPDMKIISIINEDETFGELAISVILNYKEGIRNATIICNENCTFATFDFEILKNDFLNVQIKADIFADEINQYKIFSDCLSIELKIFSYGAKKIQYQKNQIIYQGQPKEPKFFILHSGELLQYYIYKPLGEAIKPHYQNFLAKSILHKENLNLKNPCEKLILFQKVEKDHIFGEEIFIQNHYDLVTICQSQTAFVLEFSKSHIEKNLKRYNILTKLIDQAIIKQNWRKEKIKQIIDIENKETPEQIQDVRNSFQKQFSKQFIDHIPLKKRKINQRIFDQIICKDQLYKFNPKIEQLNNKQQDSFINRLGVIYHAKQRTQSFSQSNQRQNLDLKAIILEAKNQNNKRKKIINLQNEKNYSYKNYITEIKQNRLKLYRSQSHFQN